MYILKNAFTSIVRNKGRNILIGIIVIVISAACAVTLAIRQSANDIVKSYENKYQIQATIGMNRQNLMRNLKDGNSSQEEMINSFNSIESLTEDEIIKYGTSDYIKNYYYTYSLNVNASNLTEATDSLVRETTEVTTNTDTTTRSVPGSGNKKGGPSGGGNEITERKTTTTTKKTEKIFNEKAQGGAFTLIGYNSYEDMSDFISGNYTITSGKVSSNFESSDCVISEELSTLNNLSVGDTITIVDPKDESKTYELNITGIYKENTDSSNNMSSMFSSSANNIITNISFVKNIVSNNAELKPTITPTYILKNKNDIDSFKEEVTSKGLSEYYQITDNIDTIESATESVENVKIFATTFLLITLIIGGVVLVVINMINIRERKYEIGVLRTIGMRKSLVSLQFMFELLFVCVIALVIGAGIGSYMSVGVANNLLANEIENSNTQYEDISKNFGGMENSPKTPSRSFSLGVAKVDKIESINAVVDFNVLMQLLGIGIILTLLSSLASMIAISRFSPLNILKERS